MRWSADGDWIWKAGYERQIYLTHLPRGTKLSRNGGVSYRRQVVGQIVWEGSRKHRRRVARRA